MCYSGGDFSDIKIFLDNILFMSILASIMSKRCANCGKKTISGNSIARRGLPKKKGGIGLKTTGVTKRKFAPNLQSKRVLSNGIVKKVRVCTKCIKSDNLTFVTRKPAVSNN